MSDHVQFTLPRPVTVNGTATSDFTLREPTGKDLRRHTFMDLLDGNVRAMADVTPKIVSPFLSTDQIKAFGPANLMALQNAYAVFLEGVEFEATTGTTTETAGETTPTRGSSPDRKAD